MIRKSILSALAPLALAGCAGAGGYAGPDSADIASARVATVNAQQLATLIEAGEVVLIDVRTPYEFADSRIAGALNAPLTHFDPAAIPVDTTREVILYCGSSRRSGTRQASRGLRRSAMSSISGVSAISRLTGTSPAPVSVSTSAS